ncbi:Fe-S cluster assembly protein NifU [Desulfonatronospira thiodismutans ASO3-1]|uniref:Nitrogen fixation protein NifU n=1 Tax=Desulfonatronospira thiodismutans ASO3-1 TaxID=555779 RepID=D6SL91_9BACT|nr:Fe-S cluster assembly protein NifU [Desulfonatronospira thiodismutans]EFI35452.1 Fe-S cluster assembly protein NifU [Desulfonatronospira thiodismutans ASO3-1]
MWEYTDKVKEFFLNPKNAGEISDADAVGEVGSLACGDALKLFLKVDDSGVIQDASFQTFGCASAIASSSVLTELLKGKTVDEASRITNKDIARELGGLPKEKMHCSVMGQQALEAALKNLRGEEAATRDLEGEVVCECFGVTDEEIKRAIRDNNLTSVEDVTHYTKAGGGCEDCHAEIEKLLDQVRSQTLTPVEPVSEERPMTNIKRMQLVTRVVDEEIRPSLHKDGGDIELVDIEGPKVMVSFRGACAGCPSSHLTAKEVVEKKLKERVDSQIQVEEVRL